MAINENKSDNSTASSKRVKSLLGFDTHFWEQLMLGSLAAVGVTGVAVALFTAAVVISQRRENAETSAEFERYKVSVGKDIADAHALGDKAKADAANSNERAKALEVKAAELQLEIARLKAKRSLSEEQSAAFIEAMKPWTGMKVTFGTAQDGESVALVQQISFLLKQAGWQLLPPQKGDLALTGFAEATGFAVITGDGVVIGVHPASAKGKLMGGAANAMAKLLNENGIAAVAAVDAGLKIEDSVNVDVGTKPK